MNEKGLRIADKRTLTVVASLNKEGIYPSLEGLSKVMRGELDEETAPLMGKNYFSLTPSSSSKKVKMRANILIRHGYLLCLYDEGEDDYFLYLGEKGEPYVDEKYLKRRERKKKGKVTLLVKGRR